MSKLSIRLLLAAAVVAIPLLAQEQYTEGPVWRIVLLKAKPGKLPALLEDMRDNLRPLYEEYRKQGIIMDYKLYLNSTTEGPEDWNIAIGLEYKNYAALDGLTAKTQDLGLKHYGSKEARQTAADKRAELGQLVASRLMREITLK